MKNINKIKGFTLIELLVVMFILVSVGAIATGIFAGVLRGSNKGNNVNDIRQNGNYVISQMTKMIAYAQSFEGVSQDGFNFSTACSTPSPDYSFIKIKSFDDGETVFSCDNANSKIASGSADLIDTTKMKTTVCVFRCSRSSVSVSPTIDILFTLTSLNNTLAENNSTISFETSIKPRN